MILFYFADHFRICEGQKNPQEVLQQQIARYKEVFQQAVAQVNKRSLFCKKLKFCFEQVNKLDSAVEQHLGVQREANVVADLPAPVASVKFGSCPNCGEDLILKQRREGDSFYISCSAYPGCRASIWFPAAVRDVQVSDRTCLRVDIVQSLLLCLQFLFVLSAALLLNCLVLNSGEVIWMYFIQLWSLKLV